jgi:hypothetical protein
MMFRVWAPLGALSLVLLSAAAPLAARQLTTDKPLTFRGLAPGKFVVHEQQIPVDVVLIGFGANQVNEDDLLGVLPATYKPVVRYPRFYGLEGRDMGLEYTFKYSITHTKEPFNDAFFKYLLSIGTGIQPTVYQQAYNAQTKNVLDVTGPVLDISATSVESWLQTNHKPRRLGYTLYFVNWYGRSDFRFHVYTKKDDPDPDTGHNFGNRQSRAITSWGGTAGRTWFYDFSAGPEFNTDNYIVDTTDITGDGVEDYRMPPIWEYAAGGYRSPLELGFDIGLLTRFVGLNLLFTTSPLYDPLNTAPGAAGAKIVDTTMLEDDGNPAVHGLDFYDPDFAREKWRSFQPYYAWQTAQRAVDPIDAGADRALAIFTENLDADDCWNAYGTPFAQLFCYFTANLGLYVPTYGEDDYVAPIFAFNTTQAGLGSQFGLLGFADDNWVDGTQTMVFSFGAEAYRTLGYGFTGTNIHEVGHHIGMSHPHDGYDSEFDADYGPSGFLHFAWEGDESDTVMHYLGLTNVFGEHNQDNMYRWETAGYLNWANALAADIFADPRSKEVIFMLLEADGLAANAIAHFKSWRYLEAVAEARQAYLKLVEAAEAINVTSSRLEAARRPLPDAQIEKYVCRPRGINE